MILTRFDEVGLVVRASPLPVRALPIAGASYSGNHAAKRKDLDTWTIKSYAHARRICADLSQPEADLKLRPSHGQAH